MESTEKIEKKKTTSLAWSVIFLHTFNHVISGTMPMLYPAMMNEFNITYAQLGLIRSASTFTQGFPQLFVGYFKRWFNGRMLVALGNLIYSTMNIAASLTNGFLSFLGLRVIGGLGSSTQHPIGVSLITAGSDPSQRSKIFGLNLSLARFTGTTTPIITAFLLPIIGWRSTLSIFCLPALFLSLYMIFFIKDTSSTDYKTKDGLNLVKLREQLKNRNVLSISLIRSGMAFRMGVTSFLPLYFINILGFSPNKSGVLYSILRFGSIFGPFVWGLLANKVNRKALIIGIMSSSAIGFLMLNWVNDFWALSILLFNIGLMVQTVVVQSVLSESVSRSELDQVFGLYFTLGYTVSSFASILFGYIVEIYGFNIGFMYVTAVTLVSMMPAFFIKEPRNKEY